MRFCFENLEKVGKWDLDPQTVAFSDNEYSGDLLINDKHSGLKLRVYQLFYGGLRIRVDPTEPENFKRFDLSKEHIVVDQSIINKRAAITHTMSKAKSILVCKNETTATIHFSPFVIEVKSAGKAVVTVNPGQQMVFEHHNNTIQPETLGEYTDSIPNGPTAVGVDFLFPYPGMELSGLPERATPMNLEDTHETPIRLFNSDAYEYKHNKPQHLYASIPFVVAHAPVMTTGIFWVNPSDTFVNISTTDVGRKMRYISEGGFLDFIVYSTEYKDIISHYTSLTGKPAMPPVFALGYHQCRWGYKTQQEVQMVIRGLDEVQIPFDAIWLDVDHLNNRSPFGFDPDTFPSPQEIITDLQTKKRYMIRLSDPHLPVNSDWHRQSKEATEKDLLVKDNEKNVFIGECWPGISVWPDFLNPKTREWWADQYKYEVDTAAPNVFFWNDMNEPSIFDTDQSSFSKDAIHFGGYENREVHNLYGVMNTAGTFRGLINRDSLQNKRPFVLTRSFFAGSQRYTWTWTGDNTASWEHLALSLSMVTMSGLAGMPFTGADVGGFFKSCTPILLARWFQTASWVYPLFREHCHFESLRREPYLYEDEVFEALKSAVLTRYRMLPLWYTSTWITNQTGLPPVCPLWTEFPTSEKMHYVSNEVLIGGSILVAPCVTLEDSVHVTKPPGIWYEFDTGIELTSDKVFTPNILQTPVFIRGGKIITMFEEHGESALETYSKPLCLVVALGEKGLAEGEVYFDDGETFDFAQGSFIHRVFKVGKGLLKNTKGSSNQASIPKSVDNLTIRRVIVFGAKGCPENFINSSFENGVLSISSLNLPLKDDWEIKIQ